MKFRTSFDLSGADEEARAINDLIQRQWHLESVGLGNCRAVQELKREIDRRKAAGSEQSTQRAVENRAIPSKSGHLNPANRASKEARAIKDLVDRLWHLDSVGLGNCRAAQAIERELNEKLLAQSAALANADFNSDESRDRYGKWTTGSNAAPSATNSPPQAAAHETATNQSDPDDTDDIPLTYGGAHAKLRQSQSDASAQLYNKSGGEMKAVAAGGRAAAEMNPIVAFFHGIYQFFTKKDAIDSNK